MLEIRKNQRNNNKKHKFKILQITKIQQEQVLRKNQKSLKTFNNILNLQMNSCLNKLLIRKNYKSKTQIKTSNLMLKLIKVNLKLKIK